MPEQPFLIPTATWMQVKDGNPTAMSIFLRHYTAKQKRKVYQFVGPGEKMVLLTPDVRALFVWRKFIDDCEGQYGVNCAVFRNEGSERSSDLIRAAVDVARLRWPIERLYTYVDGTRVKSSNPGWCFIAAGWRVCGRTRSGLRILEILP
jgi:hypothetical protein